MWQRSWFKAIYLIIASLAIFSACSFSDNFEFSKRVSTRVVGEELRDNQALEVTVTPIIIPEPLATPTSPEAQSEEGSLQEAGEQEGLAEEDGLFFTFQPGSPSWLQNFSRPEAGCDWSGIAGQVFDLDGEPVSPLVIEVEGTIEDQNISLLALTGVAPLYGPAGFEITLANRAVDTQQSLWIQVFDMQGRAISERISFDTYADCSKNLILMNFVQVDPNRVDIFYYLPITYKNAGAETGTPAVNP